MNMVSVESLGKLASYSFGKFCPAVWKKDGDKGYGVRVLKSQTFSRSGNGSTSWEYYEIDKDGIITSCPRGLTKQFKGCKVRDIDAKVEEYKDKPC